MKDKLSKIKNLIKKYGVKGTFAKVVSYIRANYLAKLSVKERIYVFRYKKKIMSSLCHMLEQEDYDRIVVWRSSFGWEVPLFQRPQHIFMNFAKQRTLVFYEVTKFTDDVERIKKIAPNLYLVNFMNAAYSKVLHEVIEQRDVPRYLEFYSTDWTLSRKTVEDYMQRGYKVVYEYIDDLSPHLAGTDELPVNVKQKYDMMIENKEIFTVVTADALWKDVLSKRGNVRLAFSGNGVDYHHFHDEIDERYPLEDDFTNILKMGQPIVGYYGALAKWFDYELIKKVADTGKYQVVLFGIAYDDSMEKAGVAGYPNIHFLGAKSYNILQNYASHIDVLTIPFLINDITRATSPVKLFEYMAMNKPIVTTDMDECRKYKSVLIGHSHDGFMAEIEHALQLRTDASYMNLLNEEALENTWKEKARIIIEMLRTDEKNTDEKNDR